jgi:hypothetical protein
MEHKEVYALAKVSVRIAELRELVQLYNNAQTPRISDMKRRREEELAKLEEKWKCLVETAPGHIVDAIQEIGIAIKLYELIVNKAEFGNKLTQLDRQKDKDEYQYVSEMLEEIDKDLRVHSHNASSEVWDRCNAIVDQDFDTAFNVNPNRNLRAWKSLRSEGLHYRDIIDPLTREALFTDAAELVTKMEQTDRRPYPCPECGAPFAHKTFDRYCTVCGHENREFDPQSFRKDIGTTIEVARTLECEECHPILYSLLFDISPSSEEDDDEADEQYADDEHTKHFNAVYVYICSEFVATEILAFHQSQVTHTGSAPREGRHCVLCGEVVAKIDLEEDCL